MRKVFVALAAITCSFDGACLAQFANPGPAQTTVAAPVLSKPLGDQQKPLSLAGRNRAMLDQATAVAAKEREVALAPVRATSQYVAAKADLDRAAVARADAKANGTPAEILATGDAYIIASNRLHALEDPAISDDLILASANTEERLLQVAVDAADGGAHAVPLTSKQKAEAADDRVRFSPAGLQLASQFSIGNVPLLDARRLSLNDMGLMADNSGGVADAHVDVIMPPSDALVTVSGTYVRLSKYPLPPSANGKDIPLVGVFTVIGQKHLLSKFHQPTAFVLEPIDAGAVALVAGEMREQNPSTASGAEPTIRERWTATADAPNTVRNFLSRLPELKIETAQTLDAAIDQQTRQLAQIEREPVALDQLAGSRVFGATYTVNQASADAKVSREESCKHQIARLKSEKDALQHDDLWLPPDGAQVDFRVGSIGLLPRCRVIQVQNGSELLAQCGETDFWLSGIDTTGVVDDSFITFSGNVVVSGTKQYGTVMGAQRTILAIEPIDLRKYITAEAVMTTPKAAGRPRPVESDDSVDPSRDAAAQQAGHQLGGRF